MSSPFDKCKFKVGDPVLHKSHKFDAMLTIGARGIVLSRGLNEDGNRYFYHVRADNNGAVGDVMVVEECELDFYPEKDTEALVTRNLIAREAKRKI